MTQGYGFISCKETYAIHKRDVFIHRAQIEEKGETPEIGQWVEFIVKTNERGQAQVRVFEMVLGGGVFGDGVLEMVFDGVEFLRWFLMGWSF